METGLTASDESFIQRTGRDVPTVTQQIARLRAGKRTIDVQRPCTRGDGIVALTQADEDRLDSIRGRPDLASFIPASGAATRMFSVEVDRTELPIDGPWERMARQPKGLVPFHRYLDGTVRTAFDEHRVEARAMGCRRIHFTVGEAHRASFERASAGDVDVIVSVQSPATDTVCIRPGGELVRDEAGDLLFRPGGHGALLRNLAALDADVVLIKNIDNIVSDFHRAPVLRWRRRLLGHFLAVQDHVHSLLRAADVAAAERCCREVFGLDVAGVDALEWLHRPLRICGMVANEGDPGGGPFWVKGWGRQIVERVQLDLGDMDHLKALAKSTHFNPVDLVCGLRGYDGARFSLGNHVDPDAVILTDKQVSGQGALVLEHPGLWNGSMAGWSTVFAEVPSEIFNPVKTVADLLKPMHQPVRPAS